MKVYALPKELPAPQPDYTNYDSAKEDAAEKAHMESLKAWLIRTGNTGKNTGRIYREGMADGHAQYMFADNAGKSFLVHLPYGDGWDSRSVRGMSKSSIIKLMDSTDSFDAILGNARKAAKDFWSSRKLGDVVHYHNSFGAFVRGVIVEEDGEKKMRPTALVGKWSPSDLPRRYPDGTIHRGYHADQIATGETMQPHDSNMYESENYSMSNTNNYGDPRGRPAINLELPEMTPEELARAARENLIKQVVKLTSYDSRSHPEDDSEEVLLNMQALLNGWFKR